MSEGAEPAEAVVRLRLELDELRRRSGAAPAELPLDAASLSRCALDVCETLLVRAQHEGSSAGCGVRYNSIECAAALLTLARRLDTVTVPSRTPITAEGLSEVAHRMNNPLTAILGRAQILQARPGQDPGVLKAAAVIESSAQSLAALVRELGALARDAREPFVEATERTALTRA